MALRRLYWNLQGAQIDRNVSLMHLEITWPHQVRVQRGAKLESDVYFKYCGPHRPGPSISIGENVFVGRASEFNIQCRIKIGANSLISSGCKFIDHDHGIGLGELIRKQPGAEAEITVGRNVWLGANVIVLKGVSIGDGSVIGAGSVVNRSTGVDEIWAGVPARKIGQRR